MEQFEGFVETAGGEEAGGGGKTDTCDFVGVRDGRFEAPILQIPYFHTMVIRPAIHPILSAIHTRHQFLMRRDRIYQSMPSQVPNPHSIIITSTSHCVSIGRNA